MENTYSKEITDLFLNKYKELETLGTNEPKKFNYLVDHHRKEYEMIRHMRNELAHSVVENKYPFIVSKYVVNLLEKLLNEVKSKAFSFAKTGEEIICIKKDQTLDSTLKLMNKYHYSFLPIIDEEEKLIGIVSSDAIIEIFANRLTLDAHMADPIAKYISLFSLSNNSINFYIFISKDMDTYELEELVDNYQHTKSKLGIILITEHGRPSEKLIGLLTPWDLVKMK